MRLNIDVSLDYNFAEPTDVLLTIEAAQMVDQHIVDRNLTIAGSAQVLTVPGGSDVGLRNWTSAAAGQFLVTYNATVDVDRTLPVIADLKASPLPTLPAEVIPFLWPSRYCEADKLRSFVAAEFPDLKGGVMVDAILGWVSDHMSYCPGSSDATTTAVDTMVARQGVCRDYAHLTAALLRATDIPTRLVSVYALDLDPPDFHAVVEVWLEDAWHLVDASHLAPIETMVRIAAGRDATDIAFMTAFGTAELNAQNVTVSKG